MEYAIQICDSCRMSDKNYENGKLVGLKFVPARGKLFRVCSFCGETKMSWRFESTVKWIQACFCGAK